MTKQMVFLMVAFVMASFLTGCASIQNAESKPSSRQPNYDRAPFL